MLNLKPKILFLILFLSFLCTGTLVSGTSGSPQRIISLGPALTEEIYLLGAQDKLIANTIYCTRPPEAKKKEKVGTVIRANIEKILSLNPDLVLATSLSDIKQVEKMKSLGIRVITFSNPKNFDQLCKEFLRLGKILGKEEKARKIVKEASEEVNSIKEKSKSLSNPKVFIQVGAKPLFTVTEDSFINDFIKFSGGKNIAMDARTPLYSREKVIEANPDVIIIVTMGIAGKEERKIWEKYKTLNAVKNKRIYILDSYRVCSPTPVTFADTLKEFFKILHNE